jgi:hypothetical protein
MHLYNDILKIYTLVSESLTKAFLQSGDGALINEINITHDKIKKLTIKLFRKFIYTTDDQFVLIKHLSPPLMYAIFDEFSQSPPRLRKAGAISLATALISKCSVHPNFASFIPRLLNSVMKGTMEMIGGDLVSHPTMRARFFPFLKSFIEHCFAGFLRLPPGQSTKLLKTIAWGTQHLSPEIYLVALDTLQNTLQKLHQTDQYNNFYLIIGKDLIGFTSTALLDTLHKDGFRQLSQILQQILMMVKSGQITARFSENKDNITSLKEQILDIAVSSYPRVNISIVKNFVEGLFDLNKDPSQFVSHVSDFLITAREVTKKIQQTS